MQLLSLIEIAEHRTLEESKTIRYGIRDLGSWDLEWIAVQDILLW